MNPYDDQPVMYAEKDEKTVAEIRAAALKKAQAVNPAIRFVIDRRTIDAIARETIRYFEE